MSRSPCYKGTSLEWEEAVLGSSRRSRESYLELEDLGDCYQGGRVQLCRAVSVT